MQTIIGEASASPQESDHEVCRAIAAEAGRMLMALRSEAVNTDPSWLRHEGDTRSQRLIADRLAELRPGEAVLSEEARDDLDRLRHSRVWIVDPLDGTREFGEPPRDDWAVHVALCVDTEPAAGAVALPAQDRVFATGETLPSRGEDGKPPRLVASRTRAPELVQAVADAVGGRIDFMGSAGAKAMAVVTGSADIYLHAGGQYEWDSAAPVAVALAAGLHCSRIDGSPLRYNGANPLLPDLLICSKTLARNVLDVIAQHADST